VTQVIALLRGINVGKGKPVAMADLQQMARSLGFTDARTLLRTGNLVFDAGDALPGALEQLLEREAEARLGLKTLVFVRTSQEWAEAIARNPFAEAAMEDPSHLLLTTLKEPVLPAAVQALQAATPGREQFAGWGRHVYGRYPDGIAGSSVTPALWARHLPQGTARNWNTVLKLAAVAGPDRSA
jgi:uncharacterized protein (DUF1697 family)